MEFDVRGNLFPYEKISCTLQEFKRVFVEGFRPNPVRDSIWEEFEKMVLRLLNIYEQPFQLWVDGSFVTRKKLPNDIDVVIHLESEPRNNSNEAIDAFIAEKDSYLEKGIDFYLVTIYPEENQYFNSITHSDRAYWYQFFTKSKSRNKKKPYPKGFVELEIIPENGK